MLFGEFSLLPNFRLCGVLGWGRAVTIKTMVENIFGQKSPNPTHLLETEACLIWRKILLRQ